jgi:hypothetical protein
LGQWFGTQRKKCNVRTDEMYTILSTNPIVKDALDKYIENTNIQLGFNDKKELLFEYCDLYNNFPISNEVYKNVNLGSWVGTQKKKCNARTDEMYTILSSNPIVKDALDKYIENTNTQLGFNDKKELLFEYCDLYNKVPCYHSGAYKNIKLGIWLHNKKKVQYPH